MNLVGTFERARDALYEHVGFKESYAVCQIDDRTEMFWFIDEAENKVYFADDQTALFSDEKFYEDEISGLSFYDKTIYRGKKYTMIIVNTHVDGNCFFAFYDNDKEIKGQ